MAVQQLFAIERALPLDSDNLSDALQHPRRQLTYFGGQILVWMHPRQLRPSVLD